MPSAGAIEVVANCIIKLSITIDTFSFAPSSTKSFTNCCIAGSIETIFFVASNPQLLKNKIKNTNRVFIVSTITYSVH